jgi:hypothetical protein
MLGFKSFEAPQGTLLGIKLMPMFKHGQMVVEQGAEGLPPAERFCPLAVSSRDQHALRHPHCNCATEPLRSHRERAGAKGNRPPSP